MVKDAVKLPSKEKALYCRKLLKTEKERIVSDKNYSLQIN